MTPFMGNLNNYTSSVAGGFWVSNLTAPGDWRFTVKQRGAASEIPFQISLSEYDSTNAVLYASNRFSTVGIQTWPQSGRAAWSIKAADARYALKGEAGTNPNAITNNETREIFFIGDINAGWIYGTNGVFNGPLNANARLYLNGTDNWIEGAQLRLAAGLFTNDAVGNVRATSFAGLGTDLTFLNADNLASGTLPADRLTFFPMWVHDSSLERGWVQQQADGLLQVSFDGGSLTNVTALRAGTATNAPTGQPLAFTSGTNAIHTWATTGTLLTHGTTFGRYGFRTAMHVPIVITEVARWVGAANSNAHPVEVTTAAGSVIAVAPVVSTRYATNQLAWVPLDKPAFIPAGTEFNIVSQETTDWFYQLSAPTAASTNHIYIAGIAHNTFPSFFSGWSNLAYRVNFRYHVVGSDQTKEAFTDIEATTVTASLRDSYQPQAAIDLALVQDDKFKVPQLSIVDYVYNFNLNILPNQSNTWAFANGLRTNGMLAAGWNTVEPQDFSFIAVASTNTSMVLTQMSQFYWAGSAGGRGGVDVVPILIPRDANGLTYPNTNTFPGGFSNLVYVVGTNRVGDERVHVGWYWNMLTNRTWFSNEVFRATREGHVSTFLDVTVVETWLGTNAIGPHVKRAIRTFQDATLAAAEAGNTGSHSNATHGMLFYTAGVANIVPDPNIPENQWVSGDMINGVNGYLWHGGDVSTLSNAVRKADSLMARSRFFRPGHIPHWQFMNYDNTLTADWFQSKAAVVLLLPASLSTSPNAVFLPGAKMWPLTNTFPWRTVLKDPAVIPGRWVYTNDTNKRIGVRELKAKGSGTNYVVLVNLSDTNYTQFLNVTNFGGQSNVTYTAEAVWDYGTGTRTNFTFVNETTKVVGPTNVLAFVVSANPKANYVFLYEQQLQGVQGHNNATPSVGWNTRHINRLDNYGGFCTTNSGDGLTGTNSFNLPAGNYFIEARAPAYQAARTLLTLTNITRASNELTGASSYIINSSTGQSDAWLIGRLTLEEPTTFMLRQNYANGAAGGFGIQLNIAGCLETYTTVKITRE